MKISFSISFILTITAVRTVCKPIKDIFFLFCLSVADVTQMISKFVCKSSYSSKYTVGILCHKNIIQKDNTFKKTQIRREKKSFFNKHACMLNQITKASLCTTLFQAVPSDVQ